jgi:hypothetical protein
MVVSVAAQEVGKMPPIAVKTVAAPRQDGEKMAAPVAAQEAGKTPLMVVEAALLTR